MFESFVHSRTVWDISARDGTMNSTRPPFADKILCDLKGREGLAGAAGHDQLPTISLDQSATHGIQCLDLVGPGLLLF